MKFIAHEYQKKGIKWILDKPRCCLFWQMGLGKSVVTLTALQQLIDYCEISRALVVAPKKVAESTWSTEAEKWDHLNTLRVAKVMGTEKQRRMALEQKADIYVTGRDNFVWLVGKFGGCLPFDAIVIDELTSFKSPKTERFKAMKIAAAGVSRVIGLTGTPAPNGLIDLWAQMYCIDGGQRLGKSVTRYRQEYFDTHKWNNVVIRCTARKGSEKTIREKIADICLSMEAKDYLQLPELIIKTERIVLPAAVMKRYTEFEKEKVLTFTQEHADEPANILANSAAGLMNKLAQFSNGAVYDDSGDAHEVHGEKIARLVEIVESATAGVLVFYQYKSDIPRIVAKLKGYRVRMYQGDADLKDWNAGGIDVLLAHPASTAYGLNMQQGGHYVVWFGTGWNLELYQQANARLHRQGQTCPVTVFNLVCGGTVDEKAVRALEGKKSVQAGLLEGLKELVKKYRS